MMIWKALRCFTVTGMICVGLVQPSQATYVSGGMVICNTQEQIEDIRLGILKATNDNERALQMYIGMKRNDCQPVALGTPLNIVQEDGRFIRVQVMGVVGWTYKGMAVLN